MKEFVLLMHNDSVSPETGEAWQRYIAALHARAGFDGGSSIGAGGCYRKDGAPRGISDSLVGMLRVRADDLAGAREFLAGNPVFECGGTVEIRELIKD